MNADSINAENVYALVVGIEKYKGGSEWDLNGPAKDALNFASWLLDLGVKPERIQLFLSPLDVNSGVFEAAKAKGFNPFLADRNPIESAIRAKFTTEGNRGDLLHFFWGGHGIVTKTEATTRRLFFADTDNINKWNLNFNSLVEALSTFAHGSGFKQQNFLIDACANTYFQGLYETIGAEAADSEFVTNGEQGKAEQFVLFAAAEYEVATNESAEGTGRFSKAVLDELEGKSLLPDMKALAERIQSNFREKQQLEPVYFLSKGRGYGEEEDLLNLRKVLSVTNAKSQLQVPEELDSDAYSQFSEALMFAFLDQESLASMVKRALSKNLNVISQGASTYEATIDRLIDWAQANGQLQGLMEGALQRNPNSPKLKALAQTWGQK
jgi:Effector-associated domain 1/Caspase domain